MRGRTLVVDQFPGHAGWAGIVAEYLCYQDMPARADCSAGAEHTIYAVANDIGPAYKHGLGKSIGQSTAAHCKGDGAVEPGPLAVPFGVIVALVPVPERGVMGAFDGDIAQVADAPAAMGRLVNV